MKFGLELSETVPTVCKCNKWHEIQNRTQNLTNISYDFHGSKDPNCHCVGFTINRSVIHTLIKLSVFGIELLSE